MVLPFQLYICAFMNCSKNYFIKAISRCSLILVLGALLGIIPHPGLTQNPTDIRFELLDEKDGLSNHLITDIDMDSSGFLWVATKDGLNRYDGLNFKVFKNIPGDSTSLLFDYGQKLYIDRNGNLWVSYFKHGLSKYIEDCKCFKHFILNYPCEPHEEIANSIFYIENDSIVWYGNYCSGLNKYNLKTSENKNYPLPNINPNYPSNYQSYLNSVTALFVESDDLFWLSTRNGLYSFNPKTEIFEYKLLQKFEVEEFRYDNFIGILPDGNMGLYLLSNKGGISYYNKHSEKFKTLLYDHNKKENVLTNIVQNICKKNENEYWFSTYNKGIGIYNSVTEQFQFTENKLLGSNENANLNTIELLQINENILFAVTGDGLLKYDPNQSLFNFISLPITKSQNNENFQINSIYEDPRYGTIYFSTEYGNGFNILNTKTSVLKEFEVDVRSKIYKNTFVFDILEDSKGILWVVSIDYLYQLKRETMELIKLPSSTVPDDQGIIFTFKELLLDQNKQLWLNAANGTLHRYDYSTSKFSLPFYIKKDDTSYIDYIHKVKIDQRNKFWILTKNQIGIIDPMDSSYTKINLNELDGISFERVTGFDLDLLGNLIIAVDKKGVYEISTCDYKHFKIHNIGQKFGLPSNRIHSLGIDPFNNIWLSSLSGVFWLNKKDERLRLFNQSHGMSRINKYIKFSRTETASFYIHALGKYCKVDFNVLNKKAQKLNVFIDNIRILNVDQPGWRLSDSLLHLKPKENFFSFDFSSIDYTSPSLNQYAYKLEGWDQDWVYSNTRRYANYTNLNGGHYVFNLKARNPNEEWSDPIKLKVYIQSPFYKSYWFTLLTAICFVAIIYSLYLFRVRQIEREEKIKTDFNKQLSETRMQALRAQMNPHFVFNCLNSINRYIIKSDIKTSSLYLTKFAKLIRLILDNSENKLVVLSSELEALKLYIEMEQLRFDHKFNFNINLSPDVDVDHISIPPLLIQPYVENAIWHGLLHKTDPGELLITIHQSDEYLICEITDNGIGRVQSKVFESTTAKTRKSVGIKLTEERLKLYAEDISAIGQQKIIDLHDESGNACGTQVILTIPI